jgi:hypothetical protein
MFADQVIGGQLDRVFPIETRPAQPRPRLFGRGDKAVQRHVS